MYVCERQTCVCVFCCLDKFAPVCIKLKAESSWQAIAYHMHHVCFSFEFGELSYPAHVHTHALTHMLTKIHTRGKHKYLTFHLSNCWNLLYGPSVQIDSFKALIGHILLHNLRRTSISIYTHIFISNKRLFAHTCTTTNR